MYFTSLCAFQSLFLKYFSPENSWILNPFNISSERQQKHNYIFSLSLYHIYTSSLQPWALNPQP